MVSPVAAEVEEVAAAEVEPVSLIIFTSNGIISPLYISIRQSRHRR